MSIEEIVHPEDARALKVLMNVPALPKVMENVFEYLRQLNTVSMMLRIVLAVVMGTAGA